VPRTNVTPPDITPVTTDPAPALAGATPAGAAQTVRRLPLDWLSRYGVLMVFVVMFGAFTALRASTFPTADNLESILEASSSLAVVASGLTVVFVMREFDLSFAPLAGLAAAVATVLMAQEGVDWRVAIAAALVAGAFAGGVNGAAIAYAGAPSFVVTLALGTVFTGLEYSLTNQQNIFENVAHGYVQVGQGQTFGLNNQIFIAAIVFLVVWVLLDLTERGRYMHAIGANPEASHLSGIDVRRLRFWGFVIVGVCGALAGVMLSAQASSSSPNMGAPLLLPAFAAVFLGSAAFKPGEFNIRGTLLGVLFLGVVQNGLTLLNATPATINLVQGALLLGAVLLTVLDRKRR
jgi:ribose transport system permease protein